NTRAELIGMSSDRPNEVVVGLNNRDPRFHDPHLLDIPTGKLELLERNDRFAGYVADNALALRLAFSQRPDGGQDVWRQTDEEWAEFAVVPYADTRTTDFLGFDAANESVYVLDSRDRDTAALVQVSLEDGAKTVIVEDPRADVTLVLFDPATHEPLAAAANYEQLSWQPIAEGIDADLERLAAALGPDWQPLASTNDNRHWMVADNRADAPVTYYVYDRDAQSLDELFVTRPDLIGQPLAPMTSEVIPARDGLSLVSYLTLPRWSDPDGDGRPAEPLPMVLWVHGGPWARDEYGYNTYHQWFANRGYAVLAVNYRGSTGFGKEFLNAGNLEWAGRMHDDLLDAVKWAVEAGITAPDKVAIGGGSYGGYATLVGLTFTPETFACGVDIVGPSNLQTLLSTIPPYWEPVINEFASRMGDPRTEEGRKLLQDRSPLNRVDAIERPLLIGQGANDPRVKQSESDQIVAAMQEKDLPVTYVLFPDEGHGFARPQNAMAFNAIAENFLTHCLGGRAQPIGDALAGSSTLVPAGADYVPGLEAALEGFEPVIKQ
ncbi:MAG TPA: S9 family peptidase, partial [Steroidobacteraceae bacterium]|nr:S9 family peptidase [Steroidobacteraceae bacterium]